MQAIDEQVDQLASAAGKALGSFWTGIGGALNSGMQAASNIAGQIETAAVQAANRVSETTKEHVPWCALAPRLPALPLKPHLTQLQHTMIALSCPLAHSTAPGASTSAQFLMSHISFALPHNVTHHLAPFLTRNLTAVSMWVMCTS